MSDKRRMRWAKMLRWLRRGRKQSPRPPFNTIQEALDAGHNNLFVNTKGVWPMPQDWSEPQSSPEEVSDD